MANIQDCQPASDSENHRTQIVSSLLLEVFKESMPASGEEAFVARGGPPPRQGFCGAEACTYMPELRFLISVTSLLRFLGRWAGKVVCLLKDWQVSGTGFLWCGLFPGLLKSYCFQSGLISSPVPVQSERGPGASPVYTVSPGPTQSLPSTSAMGLERRGGRPLHHRPVFWV